MTSSLQYRIVDSPVGPLTLAGVGSTLMHLRMAEQSHEPDRSHWTSADPGTFAKAVEQLMKLAEGRFQSFAVDLAGKPGGETAIDEARHFEWDGKFRVLFGYDLCA
jgi:hypothetical protein